MTVGQLREILARYDDHAPVGIEGEYGAAVDIREADEILVVGPRGEVRAPLLVPERDEED